MYTALFILYANKFLERENVKPPHCLSDVHVLGVGNVIKA